MSAPYTINYLISVLYCLIIVTICYTMTIKGRTLLRVGVSIAVTATTFVAIANALWGIYEFNAKWYWVFNLLASVLILNWLIAVMVFIGKRFYAVEGQKNMLWISTWLLLALYTVIALFEVGLLIVRNANEPWYPLYVAKQGSSVLVSVSSYLYMFLPLVTFDRNAVRNATKELMAAGAWYLTMLSVIATTYLGTFIYYWVRRELIFTARAQAWDCCERITVGAIFATTPPEILKRQFLSFFGSHVDHHLDLNLKQLDSTGRGAGECTLSLEPIDITVVNTDPQARELKS